MPTHLRQRALGILLLTTLLVPPVLVAAAAGVAGHATFRLIGEYRQPLDDVVELIEDGLGSPLRDLRRDADALAAGVARLQSETQQALRGLSNLPDFTVRRGQFGATPQLRVRVPNRNVRLADAAPDDGWQNAAYYPSTQPAFAEGSGLHLAFGGSNPFNRAPSLPRVPNPIDRLPNVPNPANLSLSLRAGQLLDQTLPSQPIPSRDLTLSAAPVRQAFAPVEGGVNRAVSAVRQPFDRVVASATALSQPLERLRGTVTAAAQPFVAFVTALGITGLLLGVAILVFALTYAATGVWWALRRPAEAGRTLLVGGPLGVLGAIGARLRKTTLVLLTDKAPPATSPEPREVDTPFELPPQPQQPATASPSLSA